MKKYFIALVFLNIVWLSHSQNDIRLYTDEIDFIRDIQLSDSNYILNIELVNNITFEIEPSVILKIDKNGQVLKSLNISSCFEDIRVDVCAKFIKLESNSFVALCNMYSGQENRRKTGLCYFDDDLEITTIKMIGDTSRSQSSGSMMINRNNNLIVAGYIYANDGSDDVDSVFVREYTLLGDVIKQGVFHDPTVYYSIQNIVELPFYGVYSYQNYASMYNTLVDSSLTSIRIVFNGCNGCAPTDQAYQISDKKFIRGVTINWCDSITGDVNPTDVGFMVKDTTSSSSSPPPYNDSQAEVYKFGEFNNYDFFSGLDFVAPDTVYLLFKFWDTSTLSKDVFTLQKSTTNGTIIWSKNYSSDVNRWLRVKAIGSEILLYGKYWDGDSHLEEENSNPIIVRLDKEGGVIQSASDTQFKHAEIILFPNPVSSILTLRIENNDHKLTQLMIINVMGQSVYETNLLHQTSNESIKIDVSKFAKGAYFIRAVGNDRQVTEKFIVN